MPTGFHKYIIFVFLLSFTTHAQAQHFKIKDFSTGYRIFEINAVGNNPLTIPPFLKDPVAYENYIRSIKYNSLLGNPAILRVQNFYINAEWYKRNPALRFWKRHTLQAGFLLTNKINKPAGSLADESFNYSADTAKHIDKYSLTQVLQFIGVDAGINRRINILTRLQFMTGLHLQGSIAFVHHYKQQWDSTIYTPANGWRNNRSALNHLKGKNFFQWQLMIPLGMEVELYKKQFFIRLEGDIGIMGSPYTAKSFAAKEAHGAGIWLIYQPR